jgi:hypothetical protein
LSPNNFWFEPNAGFQQGNLAFFYFHSEAALKNLRWWKLFEPRVSEFGTRVGSKRNVKKRRPVTRPARHEEVRAFQPTKNDCSQRATQPSAHTSAMGPRKSSRATRTERASAPELIVSASALLSKQGVFVFMGDN